MYVYIYIYIYKCIQCIFSITVQINNLRRINMTEYRFTIEDEFSCDLLLIDYLDSS